MSPQREEHFDPIFHVFHRARVGGPFFRQSGDYLRFEGLLADARAAFGLSLYAYCLMPTHWHLIAGFDGHARRTAFLGWLVRSALAGRATRRDGLCGLRAIYDASGFARACRYVERNPVESRYALDPVDWRWSSAWMRRYGPGWYARSLLVSWPCGVPPDWTESIREG